uniref:NADH-ubiquinone oxidoreductase chain 6 n=2 Tax=Teinopalpus aureus TaxID=202796 RepID=A0A0F6XQZ3_9NEOP|nr:NADH dehydrogenase subunit 6 [Teinopalpus aureus]QVO50936.1 NADH dehydrogenase subunit 6 [Teinopalpus aureus wuyiensis]AKF78727.1 NADH dehydrogenase subunit 6 [Teinopalpus aureus]AKF78740.1 NADH dehydrogenase subunit 6 [Teinopalpus aureus]AKF78753.1 NADH dehydrogenase subunit 6 [Teinopalpus aureus]
MMKMFISLMIIMFSIFMFFLNHPLSMGLMIFLQTMLTCLLSGMLIHSYWFSYILFLVFLGGLLVLFIYVSSIASNELFSMNSFLLTMMIITFTFFLLLSIMFMYNLYWLNFYYNKEMNSMINSFIFFNNENKINLSKLYNNQTYLLMMMLIIYLFITLVTVVKITNIFFGPLRSINY